VDSLRLAESIGKRAASLGIRQDVLIEVNIASDERKHGVAPDDVGGVVRSASDIEGLRLRGLMTIPPWPDDPEDSRPHYSRLRSLRDGLEQGSSLELSMGMTRDFEVAIEEGATLVRVGEAIFGSRHT
jgi:pyridoxal phosphate enzyme (YggS family)